jgi:predicted amidohydrolase
MSTVRIAVASTPLTATLDEAVPAAIAAIEEAGRLGASIVCLPETGVPGHRGQARSVAELSNAALEQAWREVAEAAKRASVAAIVGSERMTAAGREIISIVLGADGSRLGDQPKTQIDPSEEGDYVPGSGRRLFDVGGLKFGVAICHEAFRYPEISRALALAGAQVVFVPHYVTTDDGSLPSAWCAPSNPYNEKALLCRALENTIYIATSNNSGKDQGSASCVISPDGKQLASLEYGLAGVVAVDIELELATARLARRWAPARNVMY